MRPNLKRFTSCLYIFATLCSGSGKPTKGILSFSQYCSNAITVFGPNARATAPRLVNLSYPSRRRANCARQYGHMKPRRNASTTGFPRRPDKLTRFPWISSNSKSGASSPGVINLLIAYQFFCLLPNVAKHLYGQFSRQRVLLARMIRTQQPYSIFKLIESTMPKLHCSTAY